jgi:hypothetical protein
VEQCLRESKNSIKNNFMLVSLKKIIWWRLAQEGQILGNLICINKKNLNDRLDIFYPNQSRHVNYLNLTTSILVLQKQADYCCFLACCFKKIEHN